MKRDLAARRRVAKLMSALEDRCGHRSVTCPCRTEVAAAALSSERRLALQEGAREIVAWSREQTVPTDCMGLARLLIADIARLLRSLARAR